MKKGGGDADVGGFAPGSSGRDAERRSYPL